MIGKSVSMDVVNRILAKDDAEEKAKENLRERLREELRAIKPGECLRYADEPPYLYPIDCSTLLDFVASIEGLKSITSGGYIYVYRGHE